MSDQNAEYISLAEAAKMTNYSQEYVSLLCRKNKIKGVKLGRNWVTTREWVQSYINNTDGDGKIIIPVKVVRNEDEFSMVKNQKRQEQKIEKKGMKGFLGEIIADGREEIHHREDAVENRLSLFQKLAPAAILSASLIFFALLAGTILAGGK